LAAKENQLLRSSVSPPYNLPPDLLSTLSKTELKALQLSYERSFGEMCAQKRTSKLNEMKGPNISCKNIDLGGGIHLRF
jgi:hypothetical protein